MGGPDYTPSAFNVLIIGEDSKEIEFCTELIQAVAHSSVDVMHQKHDFPEWLGRPSYHLIIILDAQNRLLLLEQIKRLSPATSVIMSCSDPTIEEAVIAIRSGAEDYLRKPFNIDSFQMAVKRGLDKKWVFEENFEASRYLYLLNSCQMISAAQEDAKIFDVVQSYLKRELKASYSAIYVLHKNELICTHPIEHLQDQDRTLGQMLDVAVRASDYFSIMVENSQIYHLIDQGHLMPSIFAFMFYCVGDDPYFCLCLSPEQSSSSESFESRLHLLKSQIEVAGRNLEQYRGVQELVYVDDATGLYNTRYLNYILDREITLSKAGHKSFAVLFIDADRFKNINDQYGHMVGTKVLNELGSHLKKYVREKDTLFRYGGDEFIAVLSPCDLKTAEVVAERIRDSVEHKVFLKSEGLRIHFTVSMGVSIFPDHASDKKQIIEAADHAMYVSKETSRNRVTVSKGSSNRDKRKKTS